MHVTVTRGSHSQPGITVHRVRRLAPEDVTIVDGIPVTTVARTILDLAEQLTPRGLANLLERAEHLQVFDLGELRATIARNPGRHGAKALIEALDIEAPSKEALQRAFLAVVRAAGLPDPQREVQIGPYHVDFLWPQARLAIETDGRAWHHTRAAFERDRRRDLDLAARGIQTLRVTWRMVTREAPDLAATLGRLVAFGRI
jgi:very-short-patch-repair endonuclease